MCESISAVEGSEVMKVVCMSRAQTGAVGVCMSRVGCASVLTWYVYEVWGDRGGGYTVDNSLLAHLSVIVMVCVATVSRPIGHCGGQWIQFGGTIPDLPCALLCS